MIIQTILFIYSKYSENCKRLIKFLGDEGLDFTNHFRTISVDNEINREKILSNKTFQIKQVPCFLVIYNDGGLEQFVGGNAFLFAKKYVDQVKPPPVIIPQVISPQRAVEATVAVAQPPPVSNIRSIADTTTIPIAPPAEIPQSLLPPEQISAINELAIPQQQLGNNIHGTKNHNTAGVNVSDIMREAMSTIASKQSSTPLENLMPMGTENGGMEYVKTDNYTGDKPVMGTMNVDRALKNTKNSVADIAKALQQSRSSGMDADKPLQAQYFNPATHSPLQLPIG